MIISRFCILKFCFLPVILMIFLPLLSYGDNPSDISEAESDASNQEDSKSKIIFNDRLIKEPETSEAESNSSERGKVKSKIIFKDRFIRKEAMKDEMIKICSGGQFEVYGEKRFIGEDGIFLKQAMGGDIAAISLVDNAYAKRKNGVVLMVIGGAIELTGMVLSMAIFGEYYPGAIPGALIIGAGAYRYFGLNRELDNAVAVYNDNLLNRKPEEGGQSMIPAPSSSYLSGRRGHEQVSVIIFRCDMPISF